MSQLAKIKKKFIGFIFIIASERKMSFFSEFLPEEKEACFGSLAVF